MNGDSEASYAYTAKDGSCKASFTIAIPEDGASNHKDVRGKAGLLCTVTGFDPVSVDAQANQHSFQYYCSGVLTGICDTQIDYGMLTVGFSIMSGAKYWKVKNSWRMATVDAPATVERRAHLYLNLAPCVSFLHLCLELPLPRLSLQ